LQIIGFEHPRETLAQKELEMKALQYREMTRDEVESKLEELERHLGTESRKL